MILLNFWKNARMHNALKVDEIILKSVNSLQSQKMVFHLKKVPFWGGYTYCVQGLSDLFESNFSKIGAKILLPGEAVGQGLSEVAAECLGLKAGTPVAASLIDAHAGVLGALAAKPPGLSPLPPIASRLPMICGTSTCHMAQNVTPVFINGIPGPWLGVILPNLYLSEAGQHAVGSVLDMVLNRFALGLFKEEQWSKDRHKFVIRKLEDNPELLGQIMEDSRNVHVWPDYRGNRTPLADSSLKGAIIGLDFQDEHTVVEEKWRQLLVQYLAHIQAFALETKFILETLEEASKQKIQVIYMCGGLQNNPIYVQAHADVLQRRVVIPMCQESVALGAAILAGKASGKFKILEESMDELGQPGKIVEPRKQWSEFYDRKYQIFRKLGELVIQAKS